MKSTTDYYELINRLKFDTAITPNASRHQAVLYCHEIAIAALEAAEILNLDPNFSQKNIRYYHRVIIETLDGLAEALTLEQEKTG